MPEYNQQQNSGRPQVARGGFTSLRAGLDAPIAPRRATTNQEFESQHVINTLASINPAIAAVLNAVNDSNQQGNQTSAYADEQWNSLVAQKYQPNVTQFAADNGHLSPQEFSAKLETDITHPFHTAISAGVSPAETLAGIIPKTRTISQAALLSHLITWTQQNNPTPSSTTTFHPLIGIVTHESSNRPIPPPPTPRSTTTTTYHPVIGIVTHESGE